MSLPNAIELQRLRELNQANRPGALRIPDGSYVRFKIISCVEKTSRTSGDSMLEVTVKLIDLTGRPKMRFYVMTTGKGSFKFQPFLTCIRYMPNEADLESYEPESLVNHAGVMRVRDETYNGKIRSGVAYFIDPAEVDLGKLLIGNVVSNGQAESAEPATAKEVRASVAEKLGVTEEDEEADEIPGIVPGGKADSEIKPESKALLDRLRSKLKSAATA